MFGGKWTHVGCDNYRCCVPFSTHSEADAVSIDTKFGLPSKVEQFLATMSKVYLHKGETLLQEVVVNGEVTIQEEYHYDNWNGGTYGHAVTLTVPEDIYIELIDQKDAVEKRLDNDLNNLNKIRNERIAAVFVEMQPADTPQWRENSGVYRPYIVPVSVPADALRRIWGAEHVRVFLSHKATHKIETSKLKQSLMQFGVASFVAHEDIEPTEEWHREIERALFSMDAMVALLTEDYHDSNWTDQEVGVALGRGVPCIPIRLGINPYGLMGKSQALSGCTFNDTDVMAAKIFQLLVKRLQDKSRLFECSIAAYNSSTSFAGSAWKVEHCLSMYETLTSQQIEMVLNAYRNNSQNRSSFRGMDLLKPLLEKWTKKPWKVLNNELVQLSG